MPCNVRIIQSIRIKSDISNFKRLEDVLKRMGFKDIRSGKNVSYSTGRKTGTDAVLVIPGGQSIKIEGETYYLNGDIAFVPDGKGSTEIVMRDDTPGAIVDAILQEYARQTVKDIAKQMGGKLMADEKKTDGTYIIKVLDPVTGQTIYSKVMRDGKIQTEGMGGAKTVCSAIAAAIQQNLMGVKPHAHNSDGTHVKVGSKPY